jgi:hypothetical protein
MEFKPGRQNAVVDALSWHDEDMASVCALSLPKFELYDQQRQESTTLPIFIEKRAQIASGTTGPDWTIVDDKGGIFLPDTSVLWVPLLLQAHGMGHEGVQRTAPAVRHILHASRRPPRPRLHPRVLDLLTPQD